MNKDKATYGVSDNLSMPSQVEAKRSTQVVEQMQMQEKLISELAAEIDKLEHSLVTVSRPAEKTNPNGKTDEQYLVPLAAIIREHNIFLIRNIQKLNILIETLEI